MSKEFNCSKCGSDNLSYKKFVKCITPVIRKNDGTYEYLASVFDEDDYLPVDSGFVCGDCGHPVELWGFRMETERELEKYIGMDPAVRKEEERRYQEYLKAQAEEAEQRDREQEEALQKEMHDVEQRGEAA